jgi:hypothetical protein
MDTPNAFSMRNAISDGSAAPQSLICPSWQETYFAPHQNFSLNAAPKSNLQLPPSCPAKRALANVTNVGTGCGGRGSVGRARGCRAVIAVSDRTVRGRPALKRFSRNFFRQHAGRLERMTRGSCGRQNRVVLAPVAGVKPAKVCKAQPGHASRQFVGDGGQRNSAPGRSRHKP